VDQFLTSSWSPKHREVSPLVDCGPQLDERDRGCSSRVPKIGGWVSALPVDLVYKTEYWRQTRGWDRDSLWGPRRRKDRTWGPVEVFGPNGLSCASVSWPLFNESADR